MSVVIEGIEFPNRCWDCWALDDTGDYPFCRITATQMGYTFRPGSARMPNCPLKQIGRCQTCEYAEYDDGYYPPYICEKHTELLGDYFVQDHYCLGWKPRALIGEQLEMDLWRKNSSNSNKI